MIMTEYQVIARKFRPQLFRDVIGQEAIVLTLKNAIKLKRLAQAYLFCGSRGTGKTTLARIFAKALNCLQPTEHNEPCNQCASCKEISSGSSLDVLEIDGASHRGIEDIRQINETVGYAAASGNYKIYIIDEVHMLTKEAFNALLKTLEEPPPKVKFFFATTEPHKVLPTILSRCQRFNLNRIPLEKIVAKLSEVCVTLGANVEEEALRLIARQAEGGLRDAESLLDQILSFEEGTITPESVNSVLGLMNRDSYFDLDHAGKSGDLAKAFEIAHDVFSNGKNLMHFVEGLVEHFRNILLVKLSGKEAAFLTLSPLEKEKYESSAQLYTQEQCLNLIDYLVEAQNQIRFSPSARIALEAILLHIMRSHFQLPIEYLVRKLTELEKAMAAAAEKQPFNIDAVPVSEPIKQVIPAPITAPISDSKPLQTVSHSLPTPPPTINAHTQTASSATVKTSSPVPSATLVAASVDLFVSEDPTPSPADLGKKIAPSPVITVKKTSVTETTVITSKPTLGDLNAMRKKQSQYDTLFQFAAVELEGKVQKNA